MTLSLSSRAGSGTQSLGHHAGLQEGVVSGSSTGQPLATTRERSA